MSCSLILGSGSPQRSALLKKINIYPTKIIAPDIDETVYPYEKPLDYVKRMALEKNEHFQGQYSDSLILTADTVITCGRTILPKALSDEDFEYCMNKISGRRHKAITAICVRDIHHKRCVKAVSSTVKVKRLTPQERKSFYKTEEWKNKAGGYALQGFFGQFIQMISGSYSGIIGLPMYQTMSLLQSSGYSLFRP